MIRIFNQIIAKLTINRKWSTKLPEGHTRKVTDILRKVNTRKACGLDHITNKKIIRYLIPMHHILQDLLNICVFDGYHPRAWKRAWAVMAYKPSKRRSDPCSYISISLLLPSWISSFLRDRTVKVRILGHISREIAINYGDPQGNPISPLLFLLHV